MASQRKMTYTIGFSVDKSGLNELQAALQRVYLTGKDSPKTNLSSELKAAAQTARDLERILQSAYNPKMGTINVTKFNQSLKETGYTLASLKQNLSYNKENGPTAFNQLSRSIMNTNAQVMQSNKLLDKMGETLGNTIRWTITSSLIRTITGSIQKAYSYTKNLDTSLNNIRIVTGKSAEEMADFAESANKAAKALGTSTLDYSKASLIYYQQGLSDQEVQARAETTVKVANITGQTGEAVSQELTAVWNGYKVSAKETEQYIDKLAAVAATTASNLEELSTGMSKVASAANAMGVNFDDLNAQIATIVAVTRQAPESVGTALKTIYARIGDLKVDGVDEFGVKLGEVSSQMKTMGIDVLDINGEMRDMSSIMAEVAEKWNTWTRAQQQAAAVAMAGKRQYNNLVALFENWDTYTRALETSKDSLGTLQKQQDVYMESTEAKLKVLKATWEDLYKNLFNQNDVKTAVAGLTEIVDLVSKITKNFGGGLKTLTAFGSILTSIFSQQLGNYLNTTLQQQNTLRRNLDLTKLQAETARLGGLDDNSYSENYARAEGTKLQLDYANKLFQMKAGLTKESAAEGMQLQKNIGYLKESYELANQEYQAFIKQNEELMDEEVILDQKVYSLKEAVELDYDAERITNERIKINTLGYDEELKIRAEIAEMEEIIGPNLENQVELLEKKKTYQNELIELLKTESTLKGDITTVDTIKKYAGAVNLDDKENRKDQVFSNANKILGYKDSILNSETLKLTTKEFERVKSLFEDLEKYSKIDLLGNTKKSLEGFLSKTQQLIKILDKKIEKERESLQLIEDQRKAANENINNINQILDVDTKRLESLREEISTNEEVKKSLSDQQALLQQAVDLEEKRKRINRELKASELEIQSLLDSAKTGKNIITTVTGLSSAFGSLAMTMNQVSTLFDIWNDKEKSFGQKMLQTTMSLGMAIPMTLTALDKLFTALGVQNSLFETANILVERYNFNQQALTMSKKADSIITGIQNIAYKNIIKQTAQEILLDNADALATKELSQEELKEIVIKELGESATEKSITATISFINAKIAEKTAIEGVRSSNEKLKASLLSSPWGWVALAIGAVVASMAILVKHQEKVREEAIEANKAAIEQAKAIQEEANANKELYDSYINLYEQYKENKIEKEELYNATQKICEAYKIEGEALAKITGNYTVLTEKIRKAREAELKEAKKASQSRITNANERLENENNKFKLTGKNSIRFKSGLSGTLYTPFLNADRAEEEEASRIIKKYSENAIMNRESGLNTLANTNFATGFFADNEGITIKTDGSAQDLVKTYKEIEQALDEMSKKSSEFRQNSEVYQNARKWLNENKEAVDEITEAYKELNQITAQYQATVSNLAGATSLNEFENKLKNFKEGLEKEDLGGADVDDVVYEYLSNMDNEYAKIEAASMDLRKQLKDKVNQNELNKYLDSLSESEKEYLFSGKVDLSFVYSIEDLKTELKHSFENLGTFEVEASVSLASNIAKGNKLKKADNQELQKLEEENNSVMAGFDDKSTLHQMDVIDEITQYRIEKNYEYLQHYEESIQKEIELREEEQKHLFTSQEEYEQALIELKWKKWKIESKYDYDKGKELSETELDALQKETDELQNQIDHYELLDSEVEKLNEKKLEGLSWEEIEDKGFSSFISDLDMIINKAESVKTAAELIGEGFTVAADDVEKFADTFPELLENYELMSDGSIKLNQEALKENLATLKTELEARAQVKKDELDLQIALKTAEQTYLQEKLKNLKSYLDGEITEQKAIDNINKAGFEYQQSMFDLTGESVADLHNFAIKATEEEGQALMNMLNEVGSGFQKAAQMHYAMLNGEAVGEWKGLNFKGTATSAAEYASNVGAKALAQWNKNQQNYQAIYNQALEVEKQLETTNGEIDRMRKERVMMETSLMHSLDALDRASQGLAGKKKDKTKEEKEKEIDEEFDRYWEYKKAIDMLEKELSRLEKVQSKLHGKELIESLKKENQLIEQQKVNYELLLQAQEKQAGELQGQLASYGAIFKDNGELANYADLTASMLEQYMAAVQAYNNQAISEAQYKIYEQQYEDFKKALSKYDSLYYSEMQDTLDKLDDLRRKQLENNLKAWETEIQIKLDLTEAKRNWNDFVKEITQDFRKVYKDLTLDSKFDAANFDTYVEDLNTTLQAIHDVENEIKKLATTGKSDMFESMSEAQEKLKELGNTLLEQGKSLQELYKAVWDKYLEQLDQAADKLEDINNEFDHITNELDHQRKIIELIYGDKAYAKMNKFYETQQKNLLAQMASMRTQKEFWEAQFNAAYEMNKGDHNVDLNDMSTWTEDMRKAYDQMINAQEQLNDLIEKGIQNLTDKYLNKLAEAFDKMEKAMFGMSLDDLKDDWDRMQDVASEYLDNAERGYQVQSLINKVSKEISNTSNVKYQQKLQEFRDKEVQSLFTKKNLTQEDVNLMEARYQIMLKEMALEDAKNAKTSMKLTRNTSGNWTYQYVADEDDVANKQQDVLDSYNNLYKMADNAYAHSMERVMTLTEQMEEAIKKVGIVDSAEKEARVQQIKDFYEPLIQAAKENAEAYEKDSISASAMIFKEVCDQNAAAYETLTDKEKRLVDELKKVTIADYEEMRKVIVDETYNPIKDAAINAYEEMNINSQTAASQAIKDWNTDDKSVKNMIDDTIKTIINDGKEFEKELDRIKETSGIDFKNVDENIEETSKKIEEMGDKTEKVAERSSEAIGQIRDIVEELGVKFEEVTEKIFDAYEAMGDYKDAVAAATDEVRKLNIQLQNYNKLAAGGIGGTIPGGDGTGGGGNTGIAKYKWQSDPNGASGTMGLIDKKTGNYKEIANSAYIGSLIKGYLSVPTSERDSYKKSAIPLIKQYIAETFNLKEDEIDFSELDQLFIGAARVKEGIRTSYKAGNLSEYAKSLSKEYKASAAGSGFSTLLEKYQQHMQNKEEVQAEEILSKIINVLLFGPAILNSYATGGYTGDWSSDRGKLAILHSKELVLNAEDTENFLKATNLLRDISKLNGNIEESIMASILNMMNLVSPHVSGVNAGAQPSESQAQVFNITAEFPNANDVTSIKEAILSLPNIASQYVHQRA